MAFGLSYTPNLITVTPPTPHAHCLSPYTTPVTIIKSILFFFVICARLGRFLFTSCLVDSTGSKRISFQYERNSILDSCHKNKCSPFEDFPACSVGSNIVLDLPSPSAPVIGDQNTYWGGGHKTAIKKLLMF